MAGGRQLQFDKEKALDAAMYVFWKKGFLGASLTELTSSMGINKPSMYATFGNKEDLFVEATRHYLENYASTHMASLETDEPLQARVRNYLHSISQMQCQGSSAKGCFVSVAANEMVSETLPKKAVENISYVGNYAETFLTEFFTTEQQKGHLAADRDVKEVVLLIVTFLHGLSSIARVGKPQQEIEGIINSFIKAINLS